VATRNSSGRCPTDRTADLADLRIGWTDGLPDQLADWEAIADRLTLVENRLAQAAASARPDPRLEAGISLVLGTRGTVRVGAIAELVGLSPRHLSRLWRERVGVGPKLLGRLTRFQRVQPWRTGTGTSTRRTSGGTSERLPGSHPGSISPPCGKSRGIFIDGETGAG
jgi:hypothetical protein